ncbi:MAG: molybdenum cofactor biosynthesis protein MoaE [Candidatus Ranarchaeia archaeon]
MDKKKNREGKHSTIRVKGDITIQEIIDDIKKNPTIKEVGAIGIFIGIVRESNGDSRNELEISQLDLESWDEEANKTLNKIASEEEQTNGINDVRINHMVGEFKPQEDIVYVTVAGKHREEVFKTLRKTVNRYKTEAPLWKKETRKNGKEEWINSH